MPVDSMEAWLSKQKVVEKQVTQEVKLPQGSIEEWLRTQVSERMLKDSEIVTEPDGSPTVTADASESSVQSQDVRPSA
jgi:hypothetical protein